MKERRRAWSEGAGWADRGEIGVEREGVSESRLRQEMRASGRERDQGQHSQGGLDQCRVLLTISEDLAVD